MPERVVLLHGLWMRGFAMGLLQHRLGEADFAVERFDYLSVAESGPLALIERLRQRLMPEHEGEIVHIVGHSLGGLLALRACENDSGLAAGRIVCMGSPLLGSAAARGFAQLGGEILLGPYRSLLEQGFEAWAGPRELGVIAGRMRLGLGAVVGQLQGEHDGSVAIAETRLPGLTAHCVVEASHTGLIMSADAANQTIQFLRHGQFLVDSPT
ncbi:alpha/beta fold hydrolase [Frateuria aurantia]